MGLWYIFTWFRRPQVTDIYPLKYFPTRFTQLRVDGKHNCENNYAVLNLLGYLWTEPIQHLDRELTLRCTVQYILSNNNHIADVAT